MHAPHSTRLTFTLLHTRSTGDIPAQAPHRPAAATASSAAAAAEAGFGFGGAAAVFGSGLLRPGGRWGDYGSRRAAPRRGNFYGQKVVSAGAGRGDAGDVILSSSCGSWSAAAAAPELPAEL